MSQPRKHFSRDALAKICAMPELAFGQAFDMPKVQVDQPGDEDYYFFRDTGASILAVAHLDTVGQPWQRKARFVDTEAGPVVFSRALDDRLGAYIILDMLPKLGVETDVLLTVGEESGMSTAKFFEPPRQYDWMIEFDRGGTDVVLYQYDDAATRQLVKDAGARVGDGIFSDISYLEHLGCKGANWGVGYRDYHGPRAHAYLEDTLTMVEHFEDFYAANAGTFLPHDEHAVWGDGALTEGDPRDPFFFDDRDDAYHRSWFEQAAALDSRFDHLPF